jgi:uncharacterized membrane protein YraQ (UPF0718 family)
MSSEKTTVTKGPKFIDSLSRAGKSMALSLPIILSLLFLFGWMQVFLPQDVLLYLFRGNTLSDTLTGAVLGSIFTGNAANSYIIGGELLQRGVSLFAVAAFMTAWVTVGIIQLPAEVAFLGRRFSITRNCISLVLAVMVAVAAVWTWKVF